jgi:outer membrane protein
MTLNINSKKCFLLHLIIISCLVLDSHTSLGQIKITLKQALDSSLARNLQIKQAQLNATLTQENVKQSKYNQLPNLTTSPQASFNWGRTLDVSTYNYTNQKVFLVNGSLNTQVSLFQGGQLRNQILQNKLLLESDENTVNKLKYDLILNVTTTFLQVLANQDLLTAANQQVHVAKLNVEKIKKGFNAGNKSLADLSQAQAQQTNAEVDEINLQNQFEISILNLKQLMEMQNFKLDLIKPGIDTMTDVISKNDTTGLLSQAILVNPDIIVANLQKRAAFQGIKVAKSALYPNLSLFGSIGSNFSDAHSLITGTKQIGFDTVGFVNGTNQRVIVPTYSPISKNYKFSKQWADNFYQSAGITMSIPIFNHFTGVTNIRKAKINYQIAELNEQISIDNLNKVISQAWADLRASIRRLTAAKSNLNSTKQVLYVSEKRYQIGLLNFLDYNTAQVNFNKAQFNLIQAQYDLIFRNKVIDYYLGKPLTL